MKELLAAIEAKKQAKADLDGATELVRSANAKYQDASDRATKAYEAHQQELAALMGDAPAAAPGRVR